MSPLKQLWRALEQIPGARAAMIEWQNRLGADLDRVRSLLIPTDRHAEILPVANDPYASYRVVRHGDDDIVGVHDGTGETIMLSKKEVLIYRLDHHRLLQGIAVVLGLKLAVEPLEGVSNAYRAGTYRPFAGYAFPAFLVLPLESRDLQAAVECVVSRNPSPFILLTPTGDCLRPACESLLREQKGCSLALSDTIDLDQRGQWVPSASAQQRLAAFLNEIVPQSGGTNQPAFFPTPANATWSDVKIRFFDGHTVMVKVGEAAGKFLFSELGMADGRTKKPNKQWELLRSFAKGNGVMTWKSPDSDRRNQKRREYLADNLKAFFRIDGEPIVLTNDKKGWRTVFSLESDV